MAQQTLPMAQQTIAQQTLSSDWLKYFDSDSLPAGLRGQTRGGELREVLADCGVQLDSGHEGHWSHKAFNARLQLLSRNHMRLAASIKSPADPVQALRDHAKVSGNVRYARRRPLRESEYEVIADTRVDGVYHLERTLAEVELGFAKLSGGRTSRAARSRLKSSTGSEELHERLAHVLRSGEVPDESVELDHGWELRRRISGVTIPVKLTVDREDVRIAAPVLTPIDESGTPATRAVADAAHCFNERMRGARLAIDEDRLCVETRLHSGLVTADWVRHGARSVASAYHLSEPVLRVLVECAEAAEAYCACFLDV